VPDDHHIQESTPTDAVTLVGTLPPLKGNAYYCANLALELSKNTQVDFISFRKLYPSFFYPGGETDNDEHFKISGNANLSLHRLITYYNPISWIRAGLLVRTKIAHLQWWSIPIAPIYLVILIILKLRKKKIVFTVHNVVPHEPTIVDKLLTTTVLRFGDAFIVHSTENIGTLSKLFDIHKNNIFLVHMPVHNMYGGESIVKAAAREQLDLANDRKVVLCFGNIRDYKGIDDLIRAFGNIAEAEPTAILLIVGQLWGSWRKYEKLIAELKLSDRVQTVLNYIPMSEVKYYFAASDIVALPYKRFDAQSGVGNIALAFGRPLVVTQTGGLPDLVNDNRALVEPENPAHLADAIIAILADRELYEKLSKDAERLAEKHSWHAASDKTIDIYRSL
jgi:glycosyltransferase involved in cell wall biosynthesis